MGLTSHRIRAHDARKIAHPVLPNVEKHWLTVAAADFPSKISHAANAREPVGLNRRVYRDVRESLEGKRSTRLGMFDLMNKGITILATEVRLVDKDQKLFEVVVDDEIGGVVDGAHTAQIIEDSNVEGTTPNEQYVEVYIRTGVEEDLITDIARGLNTGMQVAPKSIYNIDGVFEWLKSEIDDQKYAKDISWRESDSSEFDVRDLIGVLESLNIFDFPNDSGAHPIAAYEKWSIPLEKFAEDFKNNRENLKSSKYYRLRGLLRDGLCLYDHIRHDFRQMHNEAGGQAGKMNIMEEASKRRVQFEFPFAGLPGSQYRLTKGAAFPILGAFRNYVEEDPKTSDARWRGGFGSVLRNWKEVGPELVKETYNATREIGRMPDQIGKNRKHWDSLHMKLQLRLLRARVSQQEARTAADQKARDGVSISTKRRSF